MGVNTVLATAIWMVVYLVDVYDIISIRDLAPSDPPRY